MIKEKCVFTCDVCNKKYQHGLHKYEGHKLVRYGAIFCCNTCWEGNWDGWAPHYENTLLKHIKDRELTEPARNKNGFLPRS